MFMASSSATPQVSKYDVFLSFRGEDTRNGFTSHLYGALCSRNIDTFIDNELPRGDEISSSLLNTIKESKISVIIFSKNYADSRWCLKELEQILDCRRKKGQTVIPVFFYVDPSHVRKQKRKFGAAFAKVQERLKDDDDQLQRWKAALKEAADLSGYHIDGTKTENEFIKSIVDHILDKLENTSSIYDEELVGGQVSIEEVKSLLQIGFNGVHIIGIWGIGGIGKTTIARAVFNQIYHQFAGFFFAQNIREEWEKSPKLGDLQEKLSSAVKKHIPRGKKVLIVFDDVTRFDQMEKLIGNFDCLCSGSRIIITTRDKHIFDNCRVDVNNCRVDFYQVEVLNSGDALKLFCMNAFGQKYPAKPYEELSNKVLIYAKGLPLALKVLGRFLCGQTENEWKSKMEKLKKTLDKDIQEVLKISYDGLDKEEKDMFLDIACFFKEEKDSFVRNIFDACGFSTNSGLRRLNDLCLINIVYNTITMHDLVQEMGREIVREESKNPRKRSRLWDRGEICNVLEEETGGEEIQGIYLKMDEMQDIKINRRAFSRMHNLRFFQVRNRGLIWPHDENRLHGFEGLESFSTKVFNWEGDGPKSLPVNFKVKDLVVFRLPHSTVKRLWNYDKDLRNLTHIDLSDCQRLKKIPDLSTAVKLQELNLTFCTSLEYLPDNIPSESIILSYCIELKKAPRISYKVERLDLRGTAIEKSPFIEDGSRLVILDLSDCWRLRSLSSTILKCKSLEYLFVQGCDRLEIPEDLGNLEALKTPIISNCALREVPSNIVKVNKFPSLSLSNYELRCSSFGLPISYSSWRDLEFLVSGHCQPAKLPDSIRRFSSLRLLNLRENKFKSIPASIKDLTNLCYLNIQNCERLVSLPELPGGTVVAAMECSSLESISPIPSPTLRPQRFNLSECFKLNLSGIPNKESGRNLFHGVCYSGNQIPEWFDFKGNGTQLLGTFKEDCIKENVIGFNMCAVVEGAGDHEELSIECSYNITGRVIIENEVYKCTIHGDFLFTWDLRVDDVSSVYVVMDFVRISNEDIRRTKYDGKSTESNNSHVGMRLSVFRPPHPHVEIKQCGIHFVYGSDSECGDSRAIRDFMREELPPLPPRARHLGPSAFALWRALKKREMWR